ncbi:MAG: protease inhibitor I42 family protein [Bacteroidales bacterium]|jgi:predicted secreted protein|nr:protease inhibitor I42 family protein [Bacteroidales bacterium]
MEKSTLIFCLIPLFLACGTMKNSISSNPDGNYFEIKKGETFEIQLVTNASTGFMWTWVNKTDVSIVDSVGIRTENPHPEGYLGGSVSRYWQFQGVQKGTDTLKFDYHRPWNNEEVARQRTITVKVK